MRFQICQKVIFSSLEQRKSYLILGEEEAVEEEDDGKINPEKAKKWVSGKTEWEYSHKDVILYNLGVGSGPMKDTCELRYIYENHEDFMVSLYSCTLSFMTNC